MAGRPVAPVAIPQPVPEPARPDVTHLYRLAFSSDGSVTTPVKTRTASEKARRMMRLICAIHNVTRNDILSVRRNIRIVDARQHLCWMLYRHTNWSLVQIGRHIGRDHTTVLYSLRAISKRRPHRPSYLALRPARDDGYTPEEDNLIRAMRREGKTFVAISAVLGRGEGAIASRYNRVLRKLDEGQA